MIILDIIIYICKFLDGDDIIRLSVSSREMIQYKQILETIYKHKINKSVNKLRLCVSCRKPVYNNFYYVLLLCSCIDNNHYPYYHKECIYITQNRKDVIMRECPNCGVTTACVICDICS